METIKNFGYVLASKRLVDEKLSVGFMYRESGSVKDSGWRFFAGDEEQNYVDNPDNIGVYDVLTILEIDGSIRPYLNAPVGDAYEKDENGRFVLIR